MSTSQFDPDDIGESRTALAKKALVAAHTALDSLDKPYTVFNFGGRDNSYEEHQLDAAPMDVRLAAVRIASIAFDKATRIIERDNGGLDQAIGTLDLVADALKTAAEAYRAEGEEEGEVG